jgi:hypothetical protein
MNMMLQELESHAWDGGFIVDKGKHNDIVMALAHAIDQFGAVTFTDLPVASKAVSMDSWKGKSPPKRTNRKSSGRYVPFGG